MPWLSVEEGSRVLGVSTRTMKRMVKGGAIGSRLQEGRREVFVGHDREAKEGLGENSNPLLEHVLIAWQGVSELRLICQYIYQCKRKGKDPSSGQGWKRFVEILEKDESILESCASKREFPYLTFKEIYRDVLGMQIKIIIAAKNLELEKRGGYPNTKILVGDVLDNMRSLLVLSAGSDKTGDKDGGTVKTEKQGEKTHV